LSANKYKINKVFLKNTGFILWTSFKIDEQNGVKNSHLDIVKTERYMDKLKKGQMEAKQSQNCRRYPTK
jgi:hypothetical protein